MNQPITFFRPRQTDSGVTYSFDLESSNRRYRIFVYSRATVDDSLFRDRKTDNYNFEIGRLLQAIGPGVLVVTYEEEGQRNFQVTPAGLSNLAFSNYGLLRPGSPLSVEKIDQERFLQTSLGAHLLIPVDREAEAHLLSLQDFLAWLPPDMEALILYAISKPSLETRVSKLEAKESKGDGEPRGGLGGWLKQRFKRPVPIWPVALFLILLMLGLNAYLFYFLSQRIDAMAESSAAASSGGHRGTRGPNNKPPVSAAEQKIFDVADALRGQQDQGDDFKQLYEAHFSKLKTADDVAKGLKDKKENEPLVFGLMKLEALSMDRRGAASLVAERMTDLRKLKDFFKEHLKDHPEAGDMLAPLACEAYKIPGLPAQRIGTVKSPEFLIGDKKSCTGSHLEDAVSGLDQLISFVKNPNGAE
jgi:hypothetical protein